MFLKELLTEMSKLVDSKNLSCELDIEDLKMELCE